MRRFTVLLLLWWDWSLAYASGPFDRNADQSSLSEAFRSPLVAGQASLSTVQHPGTRRVAQDPMVERVRHVSAVVLPQHSLGPAIKRTSANPRRVSSSCPTAKSLKAALESLSSQPKVIDWTDCQLTGALTDIVPFLANLTSLTSLILDSNLLTGPITPELGNLRLLERLSLANNLLSGQIPIQLGNMSALKYLALGCDMLSGSQLPPNMNRLSGEIPPQLGALTKLQHLDLSCNYLQGSVPPQLGRLQNLQWLTLWSNLLSGSIPPELGSLGSLEELDACCNQLSGSLPPQLGALSKLLWLDLDSNHLSGRIPSQMGGMASLQKVYLYTNQLSGGLPAELGNLSQLVELDLSSNPLRGTIPPQWGGLRNLQLLKLSSTDISGTIPEELGGLLSLQQLLLHSTAITGPLPASLAQLQNLITVDLGHSRLKSIIPAWIGNWSSLTRLALTASRLFGPIPPQLGQLAKLEVLSLDSNHLSGTIPDQLSSLSSLAQLILGGNALVGSLPSGLCQLPLLSLIDVSSNFLTGSLNVTQCPSLGKLAAANNSFAQLTPLPQSLVNLDLSSNLLSGPVPGLSRLSLLSTLILSNNKLMGPVPNVSSLLLLTRLALSNCGLIGTVPSSLVQLPGLVALELDNNPGLRGDFPDLGSSNLSSISARGCSFSSILGWSQRLVRVDFTSNGLTAIPALTGAGAPVLLQELRLANNQIPSWSIGSVMDPFYVLSEGDSSQALVPANYTLLNTPLALTALTTLDLSNNPFALSARQMVYSVLHLPALTSFSCSGCALTGAITTFRYITFPGWNQLSFTVPDASSQELQQGFSALLNLDLSNNAITRVAFPPPLALREVDFRNNSLDPDGLDLGWFNADRSFAIALLSTSGNPRLQVKVKAPMARQCHDVPLLAGITAQASGFVPVTGMAGVSCTNLCQPHGLAYVTDVLDPEGMCRCQEGWSGTAQACKVCPASTFSWSPSSDDFQMKKACLSCPAGSNTNGSTGMADVCSCRCATGSYLSLGEQCNLGQVTPDLALNASCVPCGDLQTTNAPATTGARSASQCVCDMIRYQGLLETASGTCRCLAGHFFNWQAQRCDLCSEGVFCDWDQMEDMSLKDLTVTRVFLDPPPLVPGYWAPTAGASRQNFTGHQVFKCNEGACLDERGNCAKGRTGQACGECMPGFYGSARGECPPCTADLTSSGFKLLGGIPVVLGITLSGAVMLKMHKPVIKHEELPSASSKFMSALFTTHHYVQVMSVVASFQVPFPKSLEGWFQIIHSIAAQAFVKAGVGCLAHQQSVSLVMWFQWLFPFVTALLAIGLTPLLAKGLRWVALRIPCCRTPLVLCQSDASYDGDPPHSIAELLDISFGDAAKVVATLVVMLFTVLVSGGLVLLTCTDHPNGHFTVKAFPHLECPGGKGQTSQEWLQLLAPCLIYFFLIVFGVFYFVYWVWTKTVKEIVEQDFSSRGEWGHLTSEYRVSHLTWKLASLAKSLIINIFSAAFSHNPATQLIMTSLVCFGYAAWTLMEQPHLDPVNTLAEVWTMSAVGGTCVLLNSFADAGKNKRAPPSDLVTALAVTVQILGGLGPMLIAALSVGCSTPMMVQRIPQRLRPITGEELEEERTTLHQCFQQVVEGEVLAKLDQVDVHRLKNFLESCVPVQISILDLQQNAKGLTATRLRRIARRSDRIQTNMNRYSQARGAFRGRESRISVAAHPNVVFNPGNKADTPQASRAGLSTYQRSTALASQAIQEDSDEEDTGAVDNPSRGTSSKVKVVQRASQPHMGDLRGHPVLPGSVPDP